MAVNPATAAAVMRRRDARVSKAVAEEGRQDARPSSSAASLSSRRRNAAAAANAEATQRPWKEQCYQFAKSLQSAALTSAEVTVEFGRKARPHVIWAAKELGRAIYYSIWWIWVIVCQILKWAHSACLWCRHTAAQAWRSWRARRQASQEQQLLLLQQQLEWRQQQLERQQHQSDHSLEQQQQQQHQQQSQQQQSQQQPHQAPPQQNGLQCQSTTTNTSNVNEEPHHEDQHQVNEAQTTKVDLPPAPGSQQQQHQQPCQQNLSEQEIEGVPPASTESTEDVTVLRRSERDDNAKAAPASPRQTERSADSTATEPHQQAAQIAHTSQEVVEAPSANQVQHSDTEVAAAVAELGLGETESVAAVGENSVRLAEASNLGQVPMQELEQTIPGGLPQQMLGDGAHEQGHSHPSGVEDQQDQAEATDGSLLQSHNSVVGPGQHAVNHEETESESLTKSIIPQAASRSSSHSSQSPPVEAEVLAMEAAEDRQFALRPQLRCFCGAGGSCLPVEFVESISEATLQFAGSVRVSVFPEVYSKSLSVIGSTAAVAELVDRAKEASPGLCKDHFQESQHHHFFSLQFTIREKWALPRDEELIDACIEDDWVDLGAESPRGSVAELPAPSSMMSCSAMGSSFMASGGSGAAATSKRALLRARLLKVLDDVPGAHLFMDPPSHLHLLTNDEIGVEIVAPLDVDVWQEMARAVLSFEANRVYIADTYSAVFWCAPDIEKPLREQVSEALRLWKGTLVSSSPVDGGLGGSFGLVGSSLPGFEDFAANVGAVLQGEELPGWERLAWTWQRVNPGKS